MANYMARALVAACALVSGMLFAAERPAIIAAAPYDTSGGDLLLRCGRLIDGLAPDAATNRDILIEDGVVISVGTGLDVPPDVPVLSLPDHTCLPGLIDMHTHIVEPLEDDYDLEIYLERSAAENLEHARRIARTTLETGFTTVRNVGVYYGWTSRTLRDEIAAGLTIGPRMHVAGFYLTIPGGGGDLLIPGIDEADIPVHVRMGVARGPDQFRAKARAAVDGGADVLKVIASGAVLAYGGVPGSPEMTPAEIRAVVEVGKAAGIPVTAHAHGAQSIRDAILAGVDTIEHASLIDDEGIRLAIEHDVALSMDVYNGDWIAVEGRRQNWPEEFLRKNDETALIQRQNFRKAHAAGVPIVYGTDAGVFPHAYAARQFAYMVEWGMTPMEAIKAATSVAARYLKDGESLGALQQGHIGDVVAVRGDPLTDISILEQIDTVIRGGRVFKAPAAPTGDLP
ncbi:MAG: amidohydrolase family protein [Woeseiaceae bacterium]|nr:amidohydrolase family protein [Woeseiaceae bacterium]